MSSSYSCECELRDLAEKLHQQGYELEQAADVLRVLRDSSEIQENIRKAKEWARGWMK